MTSRNPETQFLYPVNDLTTDTYSIFCRYRLSNNVGLFDTKPQIKPMQESCVHPSIYPSPKRSCSAAFESPGVFTLLHRTPPPAASGLSRTLARRTFGPFGGICRPKSPPEPDPKSKHIIHGKSKAGRQAGSLRPHHSTPARTQGQGRTRTDGRLTGRWYVSSRVNI